MPGIFHVSSRVDSGPLVCMVSTLPTEPSPKPKPSLFDSDSADQCAHKSTALVPRLASIPLMYDSRITFLVYDDEEPCSAGQRDAPTC